jgi:hypothetical protein
MIWEGSERHLNSVRTKLDRWTESQLIAGRVGEDELVGQRSERDVNSVRTKLGHAGISPRGRCANVKQEGRGERDLNSVRTKLDREPTRGLGVGEHELEGEGRA